MSKLQLTLAIIKPHVVANPVALREIRDVILSERFHVVRSKRERLARSVAESFYAEHRAKFFYNRLVTFMTSGPLDLYVLARRDAIAHWRHLMGPTKVYRTQFTHPETIRGKYGLSDTRNACHGSDSEKSARQEIEFFFDKFDVQLWYSHSESVYRSGNVAFNRDAFVHELLKVPNK